MNKSISPSYYNKEGFASCYQCQLAMTVDHVGMEAFYMGNIMKYLYRYKAKNGVEDLRKALTYVEFLIAANGGGDNDPDTMYKEVGVDKDYESKWTDRRTQSSDEDTFPTL